jgi:Kelch motif
MVRHSWLKALRQLIIGTRGGQIRRKSKRSRQRAASITEIQFLEGRLLLSGTPVTTLPTAAGLDHTNFVTVNHLGVAVGGSSTPAGLTTPFGITPAQMRQAYGMGSISFGGITGDGTGQTIAIVDAYDDPNAITDLSAFDAYYGLPDAPSFKVLNEFGGTARPTTDPSGPGGWSVEESLDIEWAHVMAPQANIILFEANIPSNFDLFTAVDTARNTPGVSVVSMSFSGSEYFGVTNNDSHFLTPTGHQGVTFLAATGDYGASGAESGSPGDYPATSPNVVAVGGTVLTISAGGYGSETGWSGSGGGYSNVESEPKYQLGVQKTGIRTIPDVSMNAGAAVPVYDTYDFGNTTPWGGEIGTSLATPMLAGVIAVANQGRVLNGQTTLDGSTQTLPAIYKLPAADFHDITTGSNGYSATKGYDLVTGIGTPVANIFVPDLVGNSTAPTGWNPVTLPNPAGTSGTMTLLSDGSVMVQSGGVTNQMKRLTPDATGSYTNGSWSSLASMSKSRLLTGQNVLPSGKVLVLGGTYTNPSNPTSVTNSNTGEIYDPVANTWTSIASFPQAQFGDGPSVVLPNGKVLAGYINGPQTYLYDPTANTWSATGTKLHSDSSNNENWVLLSDGSVLSYDVGGSGRAQRYVPSTGTWVDAGSVPVALTGASFGNLLGPATLLPDGRAFFIGANGNSAIYTPSTNTWIAGPVLPPGIGADSAPGVMLANGHFLFAADTPGVDSLGNHIATGPTYFFDFDPVTNALSDVTPPGLLNNSISGPASNLRMLALPNGQVLLSNQATGTIWSFSPTGNPPAGSRPTVSGITANATSFTLSGTQLDGISGGASFGSGAEMASNYPIVSLRNSSGTVKYARTTNWTPGVETGSALVSAQFTLPTGFGPGAYLLSTSASGVSSDNSLFVDMGVGANNITLQENPTDPTKIQVLQNGSLISQFPLKSFTSIIVAGDSGNDLLTVDISNGNFIPVHGINYDGGQGSNGLAIKGTKADFSSFVPGSTPGVNGTQGVVLVDNLPVTFNGLAPLDLSGFGSVTVSPSGQNDNLSIANGTNLTAGIAAIGSTNSLVITGTTAGTPIETVAVWNVQQLTVNTGATPSNDGSDTITIPGINGTSATGANVTSVDIETGNAGTDSAAISGAINLDGTLKVVVHGAITATGATITTTGGTWIVAAGSLNIGAGSSIAASGRLTLQADVTAADQGNNGVGTLTIAPGDVVSSTEGSTKAITLRGADMTIAGSVNGIGTSGVVIRTSVPSLPMSIGGLDNAVVGVNLTAAEVANLVTGSAGTVTFGDTSQLGNITFTKVKMAGASTSVVQSSTGNGQIILDNGGSTTTALDGNGGKVSLASGKGGVYAPGMLTGFPLSTNGFTASGSPINLSLNFAPSVGTKLTIVNNSSNQPISGTFTNLPQGGVITATYQGTQYTFTANYAGGDGNDLALTAINAGSALLSNLESKSLIYVARSITKVTSTLTVTPVGPDALDAATVQISSNYQPGVDSLSFVNTGKITGTWNPSTGTLNLNGIDTTANYQAALRSISYFNSSYNPTVLSRAITFSVHSTTGVSSATRSVALITINFPPTITTDSGSLLYVPNTTVAVSPGLTVTDPVYATLPSATVQITSNYSSTQDQLLFTNTAKIHGTWNAATGMLTLSGVDTVANYQAALESVQYKNTASVPSSLPRTVSFVATNTSLSSSPATRIISFAVVTSAPVLSGVESTPVIYTQDDPAVLITSSLQAADPANSVLSGATIRIVENYIPGQDFLRFTNTPNIQGSWDGTDGIMFLVGTDSVANFQSAIRSVTYYGLNSSPVQTTKVVSFQVNDSQASSNVIIRNIVINPVPLLNSIETDSLVYVFGSGPQQITASLQITGSYNPTLTGAKVQLLYVQDGDLLQFASAPGISGSYNAVNGILTFTGSGSLATYQNLLQSVTYTTTALNPPSINRVADFQVFEGAHQSNIAARSISFTTQNGVPFLSNIETSPLSYKASGPALKITNSLIVYNPASTSISGAVIQISNNYSITQDILTFVNTGTITGTFYSATGRLILTGTDTLANYQAALRSITFKYIGKLPSAATRTISFQVTDGASFGIYDSNTVTRDINVS